MGLLSALKQRILIGDGAMGTLLYSYGVDRSFEELNITHGEKVLSIHQAYVDAGADVIQTNTYGANYIKLSRYGLEDKVKRINTEAVRLAKKARKEGTFVVGTIGGIHGTQSLQDSKEEIKRSFREQLYCLLMEGVDGLLLETYYDLDELTTVLQIAREETDLPIITNVSMHEAGVLEKGIPLQEALNRLEDYGANIVGVNCRLGPYHMIESLKEVSLPKQAFLAAYPNASLPSYHDGKLIYENEPNYFKGCAIDFRNEGVRLIGGCCGTTPAHIKAMRDSLQGVQPLTEKKVVKKPSLIEVRDEIVVNKKTLLDTVSEKKTVIVELGAPKHLNIDEFMEGAKALKEAGVDAITLADNSLATPRVSNIVMATKLINEVGIRPLVHVTARDRNLIGLQSHIMGLHTLGVQNILAITGDPTKLGDFPGATSVFDVRSFELIKLIKQFNTGISFSGKSLQKSTSFQVGAAFNPNVARIDKAVERMEKKIDCGADYFLTQPIYSSEKIEQLYEATKHIDKPIFVGIMPLTSTGNAEFLHNEVPGFKIPDDIRERMRKVAGDKERSREQGVRIAKELVDTALNYFNGIYLVTPFMRYDMIIQIIDHIKVKAEEKTLSIH